MRCQIDNLSNYHDLLPLYLHWLLPLSKMEKRQLQQSKTFLSVEEKRDKEREPGFTHIAIGVSAVGGGWCANSVTPAARVANGGESHLLNG